MATRQAGETRRNCRHDLAVCIGDCAVHGALGKFTATPESSSFGVNGDVIPDVGGYVAQWSCDYDDTYLLTAAFSWRVRRLGSLASAELKAGVGKRFVDLHATEVRGTLYLRRHAFPRNNLVRTMVAISTGLNYVTQIEERDQRREGSGNGGEHLLHDMAPEMTFAPPKPENWVLVGPASRR